MEKLLLLIDYQNDFVTGTLGSAEALRIAPNINKKIREYKKNHDLIIATKDTHSEDYLDTPEGKKLPIPHCIVDTEGWEFANELTDTNFDLVFHKHAFGDWRLSTAIDEFCQSRGIKELDAIEVIGVCTDICVISNVLTLKSCCNTLPIIVDASCCAGTSVEAHNMALQVMKNCQIEVIGE